MSAAAANMWSAKERGRIAIKRKIRKGSGYGGPEGVEALSFRARFEIRRRVALELKETWPVAAPISTGVEVLEMSSRDVGAVVGLRTPAIGSLFRRYLADGDSFGVLAWRGGEPIGHAWVVLARRRPRRVNGYFRLRRNEALVHYCYVHPQQRGQNVYPLMVNRLCAIACREGATRILVDTDVDNTASRRGLEKVGFAVIGSGVYLHLGRFALLSTENFR